MNEDQGRASSARVRPKAHGAMNAISEMLNDRPDIKRLNELVSRRSEVVKQRVADALNELHIRRQDELSDYPAIQFLAYSIEQVSSMSVSELDRRIAFYEMEFGRLTKGDYQWESSDTNLLESKLFLIRKDQAERVARNAQDLATHLLTHLDDRNIIQLEPVHSVGFELRNLFDDSRWIGYLLTHELEAVTNLTDATARFQGGRKALLKLVGNLLETPISNGQSIEQTLRSVASGKLSSRITEHFDSIAQEVELLEEVFTTHSLLDACKYAREISGIYLNAIQEDERYPLTTSEAVEIADLLYPGEQIDHLDWPYLTDMRETGIVPKSVGLDL